MTEAAERNPEFTRDRDRIVNFSDGVFAIVITLLVLTIEVPNIPFSSVARELPSRLLALAPDCLSYVISFLVVAVYWQAHHRVFGPIRGYDRTLLWLNFLFLMMISFLPERFLMGQGYVVAHRTATTLTVAREGSEDAAGQEGAPKVVVMAVPQPDGGVRIKVRDGDRKGVQERQGLWKLWTENLPKRQL